jgi:carbonic anhydrase/acetyltransferase-like protein (isoleucine patch superfamily)
MPIRANGGKDPRLAADVFVAPNAEVVGDVEMAEQSSVWYSSLIRANGAPVSLGVGTDVQDNSVVDSLPGQPCRLGNGTSLGHGAAVHASTVEDNVLVAMNATVMPGCTIGAGSVVAANATVPPGTIVPPGSLVIGSEGRILRPVSTAEHERILSTGAHYVKLAAEHSEAVGRGW